VVDIISAKHTASSHVLFAEVVQVIAGIVTRLYVRYVSDAKLMTIMASDVKRNLIDAISCWNAFFVIFACPKHVNIISAKTRPNSAKEYVPFCWVCVIN